MRDRRLVFGLIAFFTLCAAARAEVPTLRSPFRTPGRAELQARRARVGEEPLSFDAAALASLRAASDAPFFVSDFPISPGVRATVMLRRFSIAAPDARLRIHGSSGVEIRPLPDVAHFSGRVVGDPDAAVYVGARPDGLHAFVRSTAGTSYVGPDETASGYVVRDSASPANAPYDKAWACAAETLPDAPGRSSGLASKASASLDSPAVAGFQNCQQRIRVATGVTKSTVLGMQKAQRSVVIAVACALAATRVLRRRGLDRF